MKAKGEDGHVIEQRGLPIGGRGLRIRETEGGGKDKLGNEEKILGERDG